MNFREYDQNQGIFAPIIPADVIDDDDPARIISEIIEALDLSKLYDFYSQEGNPAYHPKMMLKVTNILKRFRMLSNSRAMPMPPSSMMRGPKRLPSAPARNCAAA